MPRRKPIGCALRPKAASLLPDARHVWCSVRSWRLMNPDPHVAPRPTLSSRADKCLLPLFEHDRDVRRSPDNGLEPPTRAIAPPAPNGRAISPDGGDVHIIARRPRFSSAFARARSYRFATGSAADWPIWRSTASACSALARALGRDLPGLLRRDTYVFGHCPELPYLSPR